MGEYHYCLFIVTRNALTVQGIITLHPSYNYCPSWRWNYYGVRCIWHILASHVISNS